MKILLLHNYYQQPGGEDVVVRQERALLNSAGHHVDTYFRHNVEFARTNFIVKAIKGSETAWAARSYREVSSILRTARPDIAHCHNIFPLISPSAYYACRDACVPIVQTVHNYRLSCVAGTLYRAGKICEECVSGSLWPGIRHGCYRNSRLTTVALSTTLALHRECGTWRNVINAFIAPTEFVRQKIVGAGIPVDKTFVKPHFVDPDPCERREVGSYALYVGRLSAEKGLQTLLKAWALMHGSVPLVIVGDGPLRRELEQTASSSGISSVDFAGSLTREETIATIKHARFLILPSEWYETFGLVVIEAFACGVPVICSRIGGMQELVTDKSTGLHFNPGDAEDLRAKVLWAWNHPDTVQTMGRRARAEYEAKYTAERNYPVLIAVYRHALESSDSPRGKSESRQIGEKTRHHVEQTEDLSVARNSIA